jgi:hypothetical protein
MAEQDSQWQELNTFWTRNDIARRLKCWETDAEGVVCVQEYSCNRNEIFSETQIGGTAALGWPSKKPTSQTKAKACAADKLMLEKILHGSKVKIVLELSADTGGRTQLFCKNVPKAAIYSSDVWQDLTAQTAFTGNLWDSRSQVTPLKMLTVEAIKMVNGAEIKPGLIYMVPDLYAPAQMCLEMCLNVFPAAIVCGGGWEQDEMRKAVVECREGKAVHVQDFKVGSTGKSLHASI